MARKTWAGRPMAKRAKTMGALRDVAKAKAKAQAAEEKDLEIPDDQPGVLAAMADLCNQVDVRMRSEFESKNGRPHRDFSYYDTYGPWYTFDRHKRLLTRKLLDLLPEGENGDDAAKKLIVNSLKAEDGAVPSFARPGHFLIWLDFIPIFCSWGGYMVPGGVAYAIDPSKPFLNEAGGRYVRPEIATNHISVEDRFREVVVSWTVMGETSYRNTRGKKAETKFAPVPLTAPAKEEVVQRAAEHPWVVPLLKRGPVNPLKLPLHIKSVQMALA